MKKIAIIVALSLVFFCMNVYSGYTQGCSASKKAQIKTSDVNKDGKPDVTYYSDSEGKCVTKAEADTNYDGKPDVIVHTKDGKFQSAEVDTDYDGKTEKKFNDEKQFNQWLNGNNPDFNDKLSRQDWKVDALKY